MAKYKPKDGVISFKKATENMDTKEKWVYIFDYYKKVVIGVPIGILILVYLIISLANRKEVYLNLAVINGFYETIEQLRLEHDEIFTSDEELEYQDGIALDATGLTTTLNQLLFDESMTQNYEIITQYLRIDINTIPIFVTLTGVGDLDLVISYEFDFESMHSVGHFQNIRQLNINVPDDVFFNDYGISLVHLPFFDHYLSPTNLDVPLILAIPMGSQRISTVENLLNTLFE